MSGTLTIRRARLVLPDRVVTGDLVVVDGVIEQIGPGLARREGVQLDGAGLTVLPGAVDALACLPLGGDGEALARETGAAASAGVTSVVAVDPRGDVVDADDVEAALEFAGRHARVHTAVLASAHLGRPGALRDLGRAAGVHVPIGRWCGEGAQPAEVLELVLAATPRWVVVEGQDPSRLEAREALYQGATDPTEHSRIYTPELAASVVELAGRGARKHGQRLHFGRISSAAELRALAGVASATITGQATVPHLFLRADAAYRRLGTRAVVDPPLRGEADVVALWEALRSGALVALGSGHVATPVARKDLPYPGTQRGMPAMGAMLPLLVDRAARGDISLTQVASWTADAPARLVGLPRVGRLEVGFDADLMVVDTEADHVVDVASRSWSAWSPFHGFTLRGRPVVTFLRGRAVFQDGRLRDGVRGSILTPSRP